MIAALGMYDTPESAPALDRLWAHLREGLRAAGHAAPAALTRGPAAYWPAWQSPDLLLSQTCGYPYRAKLHPHVGLVGTPVHDLPDTPAGYYHSVVVTRADEPRHNLAALASARLIWSEDLSQSGWAALANLAQARQLRLNPCHRSGGHRASAQALRQGLGDYAAIDAVTWQLMQSDGSGDSAGLRVAFRTPPTPALPFICAKHLDPQPIFSALEHAICAIDAADRRNIGLHGVVRLPSRAYLAVPNPPDIAHYVC